MSVAAGTSATRHGARPATLSAVLCAGGEKSQLRGDPGPQPGIAVLERSEAPAGKGQ